MYKLQAPHTGCSTVSMHATRLPNSGIPLNVSGDAVTVSPPDYHCMVYGVSGKGKSRRVIYPSVVMSARAGHSMIVCDPKGAVYRNTAAEVRKCGHDVKVINLRNPELGSRWSPFAVVKAAWDTGDRSRATVMLRDIANVLIGAVRSTRDAYWHMSAADTFVGTGLLLLEQGFMPSIAAIHALCNEYAQNDHRQLYRPIIASQSPVATPALSTLLSLEAEQTLGCVISTFNSTITPLCDQEDLREMTDASDISFCDIITRPTAVYLIVPDESTALYGLASLFVEQSYAEMVRFADEREDNRLPRPVDFIIDEFASFPGTDWPAKLTAARSRRIRFILALQSLSQLYDRYGREAGNTIISNCRCLLLMGGRDLTFEREIGRLHALYDGRVVAMCDDTLVAPGHLPDWTAWGITAKADLSATARERISPRIPTLDQVLNIVPMDCDNPLPALPDEEVPF